MQASQIAAALRGSAYDGPFLAASAELLADAFVRAKGGDNTAAALWLRIASSALAPFQAPADGADEVEDAIERSLR